MPATRHQHHFEDISPDDFERLVYWLVKRSGEFDEVQWYGGARDRGRDVVVYKHTATGREKWYIQCKRYQSITFYTLRKELDNLARHAEKEQDFAPDVVVFATACPVPPQAKDRAAAHARGLRLPEPYYWGRLELDERLKAQPEIESEFFGAAASREGLFAGVPAMRRHLVGRDDLMAGLIGRLTSGQVVYLALEGLPGVGKTALAVALAHHRQVLSHFKDGVLWAGLGPPGQADPTRALGAWANALGGDVSDLLGLDERREAVKTLIGQRSLLLVIDDAWEVEEAEALRCGGPNCGHLLTTRDKAVARAFAGPAQTSSVLALDESPAYALLERLAPEACQAGPAAVQVLARAVGGLPLALELLGGYLAAPERSYFPDLSAEALAELAGPSRRLQLAQKRLGARGGEVTLQEAIALSLEDLPYRAVAAFHALGALAPRPERFSREAAPAVAGADAAPLALLAARNLVEVEGEVLALHQVLADVARTRLDDYARARHRDYYLALVEKDREDWRRIEAVYGQIKWAWRFVPRDTSLLDWVWALRIYQWRCGLWRDQIDWIEEGLKVARAGGRREDEGTLLTNIGAVYDSLGQREVALEYYERARPIREEVGDRAGLAATLNNIGQV